MLELEVDLEAFQLYEASLTDIFVSKAGDEGMRDFLLVLKFELQTMVRKKSFLISTVLVAAAAFVLLSIPRVFSDDKGTDDTASEKDKTMLIYDGSGILKNRELAEKNFPEFQISYANSLSEVEEKVKKSEADAALR